MELDQQSGAWTDDGRSPGLSLSHCVLPRCTCHSPCHAMGSSHSHLSKMSHPAQEAKASGFV